MHLPKNKFCNCVYSFKKKRVTIRKKKKRQQIPLPSALCHELFANNFDKIQLIVIKEIKGIVLYVVNICDMFTHVHMSVNEYLDLQTTEKQVP